MKTIKTINAVGAILAHDVTEIVSDKFKGVAFKKGHIIKHEDIEKLLSIGKENIYIWEETEGILHENDAAIRIADLICGDGILQSETIKEGKVDFFAKFDGLLKINVEQLYNINILGEIIVATMHNNMPVSSGEKIAGTRVIPLAINEEKIIKAEKEIEKSFINVLPFKKKKCLLLTTGNEIYNGKIKDAFKPIIEKKLAEFGSSLESQKLLKDDKEDIKNAIMKGISQNIDLIICTGGMSVDPDDVTPTAIKECGGELISYGAPVLPGSMFLLAYHGKIPVLGIPSCAMYSKRTILDLVLPRVLADDRITLHDIAMMGHGGLCLNCEICTYPHCSFGK